MEPIIFNISHGVLMNITGDYVSHYDGKDYSSSEENGTGTAEGGNSAPSFSIPIYIYITVSVFYMVIFLLGVVGKKPPI